MFFVLSKILWFFLQPLNVAIILICGAMAALKLGRRKWATWMGMGCCAVLVVFAVLPTGPLLTHYLETRYGAPDPMPRRVDGIILLGGVLDSETGMDHGVPQIAANAGRLITFANLAYKYPRAKLIYSSGIGTVRQQGVPEADMATAALASIGARFGNRLAIEPQARTTYENAVYSKKIAQPREGQVWLVVTSAWHMPRTLGVFEAEGWHVIPAPGDWRTGESLSYGPGGFLSNLAMSHLAIKEVAGIALYGLTGKWKPYSSTVIPAKAGIHGKE